MDAAVVFGLVGLFLLLGGGMLFLGLRGMRAARASHGWPSEPGTVISSELITSGGRKSRWYHAQVTYTFVVNGQSYTGDKVVFGDPRSSSMAKQQRAVDRYTPGAHVEVFYNPQQPQEAVLERKTGGGSVSRVVMGALLLIMAVFVAVMALAQ